TAAWAVSGFPRSLGQPGGDRWLRQRPVHEGAERPARPRAVAPRQERASVEGARGKGHGTNLSSSRRLAIEKIRAKRRSADRSICTNPREERPSRSRSHPPEAP